MTGEEEFPKKKHRSERERDSKRRYDGWRTVESQQAKKTKKKRKKKEREKQEHHWPPKKRKIKDDALIVEANDKTKYAAFLMRARGCRSYRSWTKTW